MRNNMQSVALTAWMTASDTDYRVTAMSWTVHDCVGYLNLST